MADKSGRIAGFFTLSTRMLDLTGLPAAIQKGRPHFPVPATLLARFAVDDEFAGEGVGKWLLAAALSAAHESSRSVASAAVVLDLAADASASAGRLYGSVGFTRLESNPSRMILSMENDRDIALDPGRSLKRVRVVQSLRIPKASRLI